MADLNQLYSASYNAVPFLFKAGNTTVGRKTVSHEYPQGDQRFVEDLGMNSAKYAVTAVIAGPNYFLQRDALLAVLNMAGPGVLIHPTFGIKIVSPTNVVVREDLTSFGECQIDIEFETSMLSAFPPTGIFNALETILGLNNGIVSQIYNLVAIGVAIGTSPLLLNNMAVAINRISTAAQAVTTQLGTSPGVSQAIQDIQNATTPALTIAASPAATATALITAITAAQDAGQQASPQAELALNQSLFSFGDDFNTITPITPTQSQLTQNNNIIANAVQALALADAYASVAAMTFETIDEIEAVRAILETQFQKLFNAAILDDATMESLTSARDAIRQFFDQQSINAYKIVDITTAQLPLTVIAYNNYEDVDKTEDLIALNGSTYPSAVEGTIKVLGK